MSRKVPASLISGIPRRLAVDHVPQTGLTLLTVASAMFVWLRLVVDLSVSRAIDLLCYEWRLLGDVTKRR